jgi:hypothetical protein
MHAAFSGIQPPRAVLNGPAGPERHLRRAPPYTAVNPGLVRIEEP